MIRVSRLDHVAITCSDPEKSIAFYRNILGMTVAQEWPNEVRNLPSWQISSL